MKAENYLVKEEALVLQYLFGKGAWTYHIIIPNSKDIKGKWGDIKVSGTIDGYPITNMNLAPMGDADKRLSINGTIRKTINKSGGDLVTVTLYLDAGVYGITEMDIINTFEESGMLKNFQRIPEERQREIVAKIQAGSSEEKQVQLMVHYIETLKNALFSEN